MSGAYVLVLDDIRGAVLWSVVVGFVGAHLVAILAYYPERLEAEGFTAIGREFTS